MKDKKTNLEKIRYGFKDEWETDRNKMGFFYYWYFQYVTATGLMILEPWERRLFRILFTLLL